MKKFGSLVLVAGATAAAGVQATPVNTAAITRTKTKTKRAKLGDKLICNYTNGYFRVSDGIDKWEKYIGTVASSSEVAVECGEKSAAALAGSYFVYFHSGVIESKFIGPMTKRLLTVSDDLVAGIAGSYFVTVRGSQPTTQYIGSWEDAPILTSSKTLAAAVMGSYFVVTDGKEMKTKYIVASDINKVIAGENIAGALIGNYFVGYANGEIVSKYEGARSEQDTLARGKDVIAASMGNYFVVLDASRNKISEKYIGVAGAVKVINSVVVHQSTNGQLTRYNLTTGQFE